MFNAYFFRTVVNVTTIYLICGLGNCITMKSGNMNLGGEGQIYAGGFVAAMFLNAVKILPGPVAIILAMILSAIISSLITLLSCFLRIKKNIDFLLSSFIISSAIIPLLDGLITGPFRTTQGTLLATPFIQQNYRYSFILNIFISLIFTCLIFLFINKTKTGKEITIYGTASEYSLFMGVNETKILTVSSSIAGALHGIAGAMAVCGIYYTCHCNFSQGMGWNALAAAMIARTSPILLLPSAIFMGFITSAADQYALFHNFNFDISILIQAVIIFTVAIPFGKKLINNKKRV